MTTGTQDNAAAIPTKQFFVSMLTRDISLADAILDLLDNCLDGALRVAEGEKVDYAKHFVKIKLSADEFSIADNCGGIPREVAKNYAFKMGREPDDERDSDAETIGMYGVGMKRAIFKMGREALVRTRHDEDTFEVPIIVFPIYIRTLYIKAIVELLRIEYREDEKMTELCRFFPSKT